MLSVRVLRPVTAADAAVARALETAAAAVDGHESLGAAVWRNLASDSPAAVGFLALDDGHPVGFALLAPADTFRAPRRSAGLVVHPGHRHDDGVADALLDALVTDLAAHGGGLVAVWIAGAGDGADALMIRHDFSRTREQLQMRVALPCPDRPHWPTGITVRSFRVGHDERLWLTVNNRAFRNHPDQGGWIAETLQRRMAEPWFDPAGFLLAFDAGGLAGFCWTKVHDTPNTPDAAARLGEIFVIGVDPDRQGTGLGRALVLAGLEHLATDRACATGMLFVDAANGPALALYRALGFAVQRADRAYECEVPSQ